MVRTHFKIGFRNIVKNRIFFALNAGGLTIGLTAVLLISLWVYSELSHNSSLTHYDSIAAVMQNQNRGDEIRTYTGQPMQMAPVLREEYGNHFKHVATSARLREYNVAYNNEMLLLEGRFAEPDLAHILDLTMLAGKREALADISSVLLSKSTAKNIFGLEDPIGKVIKIDNNMEVEVAGIYEDLPNNSNFADVNFIAPFELLKKTYNYEQRLGWGNYWFQVYVQLNDSNGLANATSAIKDVFLEKYVERTNDRNYQVFLFPMSKWHLHSEFENGVPVGGRISYVRTFSVIGIFILLLACINFMNLSTAHALKRGKEVGVRKTLGSSKRQLIFQFFTESFLTILFAFGIALALTMLLLPAFNTLTLKEIAIPFATPMFWLICLVLIVVTAVFSSLYPSFYLSAFDPVKVLKGFSSNNKTTVNLRKGLIVLQFAISSILIIGTITIVGQINHAKDRPLGFDKDLLVSIPIHTEKVLQSFDAIKNELLTSKYIDQVTASDVKITSTYTTNGGDFEWKNKDPKLEPEFYTIRATEGFGKMIDWNILEGRDFSREFPSDSLAFLVNETAVSYMGLENPVGEHIRWGDIGTFKVIGVVQDMVTRSPFDPDVPSLYILHKGDFLNYVNVKIASGNTNVIEGALAQMKSVFQKYNPENLFSYTFIDEEYERKFNAEQRIAKLVAIFAIVAIFISCLGVLGLSTYMAIQRKKEIGIRKVLGASIQAIWQLLSKQFIVLVMISLVIAIPLGYYFSSQWLLEYSYRMTLNIWIFVSAGAIVLGISLITVSFQAIKAAIANPVNSLRTE
ncbi:MAG: ABC transporter permease [Bacteroidota bacterium]